LVRGGLFWSVLRAAGLARGDGRDLRRQIRALAALTWAPLVAIAAVQRLTGRPWDPVVLDPAVHVRLLVAVPLLLSAEHAMGTLSERCVQRFVQSGLVPRADGGVRSVLSRGERLRDAWVPEGLMAVAVVAWGQASLWGLVSALGYGLAAQHSMAPLSVARVFWATVSLPVAQILLCRSGWRWAIWSIVLWGLARLPMQPVALHPDRRGGLAFLAEPTWGFAIVVLSVTSVAAAVWAEQVTIDHLPLSADTLPLAEMAVVAFVVTFGPLFVFTKCMWSARFVALRQYDLLAVTYTRAFHRKWIDGDGEGLLGTADIQSMADLGNMLGVLRRMTVVPFGWYDVALLVAALGLPMLPLVFAVTPLHQVLRTLVSVVSAAPLPR
jgi:hypothetical protein